MRVVNADEIISYLEKKYIAEKQRLEELSTSDLSFTKGAMFTIQDFIHFIKTMSFESETAKEMIVKIESPFDKKMLSEMVEDLLAKDHEHDYFLAGISESYFRDHIHKRSYKYGTLVCRKCGETKEIMVENCPK